MGRLFAGDPMSGSLGYAAVPVVRHIDGSRFQVFFSDRDSSNRSFARTLEFDMHPEPRIISINKSPVLLPSKPGLFDDSGVMPTAYLEKDGHSYIFYIGWNRGVTVPFRNSIGLAEIVDADGTLERVFDGAIMDRNRIDKYFVASCDVQPFGDGYRAWYLSCTDWKTDHDGKQLHCYHIRYADSKDMINWNREGRVAIDFKYQNEYAISTPRIFHDKCFQMLYSYRASPWSDTYRIGYAESDDGTSWTRMDEAIQFDDSTGDWDNEMICYPSVFCFDGKRYILYNGNGYGRTGFGIARLT